MFSSVAMNIFAMLVIPTKFGKIDIEEAQALRSRI
jgi:hypothetical protein